MYSHTAGSSIATNLQIEEKCHWLESNDNDNEPDFFLAI